MTPIGWMGGQADAEAPALPLTALALRRGQRGPGDTLAVARARSAAADARAARDAAADAPDPDERASALVSAGYDPGAISVLSQQLADTTAELESENEKIARGQRRAEHVRRDLAAGSLGALEAARRLDDGDFGDVQRVQQLERRAESLRRQLADASALISPQQQRDADPLEAASRRANQAFREATRAKMEQAAAAVPEPRPFALAGRGAGADPPTPGPAYNWHPAVAPYARAELQRMIGPAEGCGDCAQYGATPAESAKIHAGAL